MNLVYTTSHFNEKKSILFFALGIELIWGVLATHILRLVLKRINWIRFSIDKVVLLFIIGVLSTGLIFHYGSKFTAHATGKSFDEYVNNERQQKAVKIA